MEKLLENCRLCPRRCGVNRLAGERGYCGEDGKIRGARAALHFWEEPCLAGNGGSGAVFFTGCSLGCVYCQNAPIARGSVGKEISVLRLAEIFMELKAQGAQNINLVTGAHFVPQIAEALRLAKEKKLNLPIVYNSSGYESVDTLRLLEGLVDIYLPDLKYLDGELAKRYSQAPDYPTVAKAAIAEMVRQVGTPVFRTKTAQPTEEGLPEEESCPVMERGVIVRHLVLPGQAEASKRVVRYLYETYGNDIFLSILNQYTPMRAFPEYPELSRPITAEEYDQVVDYAIALGVEQGFIQEGETARESFIPEFDVTGI